MTTFVCPSCGRKIAAAPRCPHCGAAQSGWVDELARIERSIADLKARDAELLLEQGQIAAQMQAALFRRDALAHTRSERAARGTTRPHRVLRRRAGRRPPTGDSGGPPPPRVPRQPPFRPSAEPPRGHVIDVDEPGGRPEASTREVQNVLLGLSALLLGVAAFVFAALTIGSLDELSRVAILVAATVLMLLAPTVVARRGLTATAETIAAVGLLLILIDGYAVWTTPGVPAGPVSASVFAGLTFAATAAVASAYARWTGLTAPRYATVLAVQPIVPLFAYDLITSASGWALVLVVVAVVDLYVARLLTQQGRLVLPPWLGPPAEPPVPGADGPGADRPGADRPGGGDGRPESAPEEADAVLRPEPIGGGAADPMEPPGVRRAAAGPAAAAAEQDAGASIRWLWELTWGLHGLAVLVALGFGVLALTAAATVPSAAQAGAALVVAAGVGLVGALTVRQPPLPDIAAGILTLAIVGALGRVAAVALPGRALLLIAAVIAVTGLGVRALPEAARRGPQLASAVALIVIGVVVAGNSLRAALDPVRAALPAWRADLAAYPAKLAAAVGPTDWQLAAAAFLLTIAAVLALPREMRREFAVAGSAITALAMPASLGLPWSLAPWPPLLAAIGVGMVGLSANTLREAQAHVIGSGALGLAAAGAGLARPALTGAVLAALAAGGTLVAVTAKSDPGRIGSTAGVVGDWAAGGAVFAVPGAVAGFIAATAPAAAASEPMIASATTAVLAATNLAVCGTLGYAALTQVAQRQISLPLAVGAGLGALAVAAAGFGAPGATAADSWVGAVLMAAALLLFLTPSIDSNRRPDRWYDGADVAAAGATAALVATLSRTAAILAPGTVLAAAAALVLVVAVGIRAMPAEWRRGPRLGIAASGGFIALLAGWTALRGGIQVLITPGAIWNADVPATPATGTGWQAPLALVLLAGAAAIALPRPWSYDVSAACVGLATIGTPAAFGLPWWSPIVVGSAVAAGYGVASVVARDPRAAIARAVLAGAVALHGVAAGLARPGTTAVALGLVTLVGTVVAALARILPPLTDELVAPPNDAVVPDPRRDPMPRHVALIGGAAAGGALLAAPGALAAMAAALQAPATVVLAAALGATSLGLAVVALVRNEVPAYLPYATVGVAGGATAVALASLPTGLPTAVYAAAAVVLAVVAELVRAATPPPAMTQPVRRWTLRIGGVLRRPPTLVPGRWSVSPAAGAGLAAVLPATLAVAALAPALTAALVDPFQTLDRIWQGPPPRLTAPPADAVAGTNVLAALLLTIAAALAAVGFTRGKAALAVPVVLPGAAVTLLITPISLGQGWPVSTLAALVVFTISVLGLALTPPPPRSERARPLRITRAAVFGIGLAAGGAGLAGSLATERLTLFTLGSAVGVGALAASGGRTRIARILGWLFAAVMAQLFVLTAGLSANIEPRWSAFGVLAVGAALLLLAATLPRLRRPESLAEATTVEWSGYAAALIALALAFDSLRHVAALLAAWGAVLGASAVRPGRSLREWRILFWAAVACEITAWWLLMSLANVAIAEVYTLPFAALALLVGLLELRQRPDLSSWLAYGPALVAALLPSTVIVLATDNTSQLRQVLLLLAAVGTLIVGSVWQQQAPIVIGAVTTTLVALHALTLVGPWLVLIPVGIVLLVLGASSERRRRVQERLRVLRSMR